MQDHGSRDAFATDCWTRDMDAGLGDGASRKTLRLHLNFSLIELERAQAATGNAETHYKVAADACAFLATAIDSGACSDKDEGLMGVLHFMHEGFLRMAETQGAALSDLELELYRASKDDYDFIPRDQKETAV